MLTALLPSSSAPIKRSRAPSRRLTIAASAFPCFSRCARLMRECAVSAVSLPEKNADSSRQTNTISSEIQSSVVMRSSELLAQKVAHFRRTDVGRHECLSNATDQNKSEFAALHLLVLGNQLHQTFRIGQG